MSIKVTLKSTEEYGNNACLPRYETLRKGDRLGRLRKINELVQTAERLAQLYLPVTSEVALVSELKALRKHLDPAARFGEEAAAALAKSIAHWEENEDLVRDGDSPALSAQACDCCVTAVVLEHGNDVAKRFKVLGPHRPFEMPCNRCAIGQHISKEGRRDCNGTPYDLLSSSSCRLVDVTAMREWMEELYRGGTPDLDMPSGYKSELDVTVGVSALVVAGRGDAAYAIGNLLAQAARLANTMMTSVFPLRAKALANHFNPSKLWSPEEKDALKASIRHWKYNVELVKAGESLHLDTAAQDCACCHLAVRKEWGEDVEREFKKEDGLYKLPGNLPCELCPIGEYTGLTGCEGTPFNNVTGSDVKSVEAMLFWLEELYYGADPGILD